MIGIYRVYQDGVLQLEQKNKLTLLGRSNALSTMLGLTQSFAGSLGIGVSGKDNGTDTFLDMTDLDFSVGKYPITATSLKTHNTNDALVYTARITDPSRYDIYELGIYSNKISSVVDVDALTILNFESGDAIKETVSSVDYYIDDVDIPVGKKSTILTDGINYRIGTNALKLETGGTVFYDTPLNLSSFYPYDSLKLAFYSSSTETVTVKFYSDTVHADFAFTAAATGYHIMSIEKHSVTPSGTMDWSNITKIEVVVSGGSYVNLDGLRIAPLKPKDSIDGLVSRTYLDEGTKITKNPGSIIDIEYLLVFNLG